VIRSGDGVMRSGDKMSFRPKPPLGAKWRNLSSKPSKVRKIAPYMAATIISVSCHSAPGRLRSGWSLMRNPFLQNLDSRFRGNDRPQKSGMSTPLSSARPFWCLLPGDTCRRRMFISRPYSCRRATIGSTRAARMAGYSPKTMPIVMLIKSGSKTPESVISVVMCEK